MAEPVTMEVLSERLANLSMSVAQIAHQLEEQNQQFNTLPYLRQDLYEARHEALRKEVDNFREFSNREFAAIREKYSNEIAGMRETYREEMNERDKKDQERDERMQWYQRILISGLILPVLVAVILYFMLQGSGAA